MKKLKIAGIGLLLFLLIVLAYAITPNKDPRELRMVYGKGASQYLSLEGMDVHYRIEGAGVPLVLIHGTASSLHTWDEWTEQLKSDFKIIRLDMPAFGLTGPHPEKKYSLDDYASFLNAFLTQLDVDTLYLAGNSLGGAIAWNYTLTFPEKVKKLMLIDAAGFPKDSIPQIFKLAQKPVTASVMKWVTPRFLIAKNMKEVYYDHSKISNALIKRYHDMTLRTGNRQAFVDRAKLTFADQTSRLSDISCPTLIQWGLYDRWIPVKDAEKFNELIQNSRVVTYEAGHVPMEELPMETANDARAFLLED